MGRATFQVQEPTLLCEHKSAKCSQRINSLFPRARVGITSGSASQAPIGGVGIELWTMQDGILFDNLLVTTHVLILARASVVRSVVKHHKYMRDMADATRSCYAPGTSQAQVVIFHDATT